MRIFQRIRALFNFKGQRAEMELESADVRGNKVFLHPVDDPDHTFCVSGKGIDIVIDPAVELTEDDFMIFSNTKLDKLRSAIEIEPTATIEKLLQPKATVEQQQPNHKDPQKKTPEAKLGQKAEPEKKAEPKADEELKENPKTAPKMKLKADGDPNIDPRASFAPDEKKTRSAVCEPNVTYSYELPKMHTVTMKLYPEEYEMLMAALDERGYRKTEFLLACVAAAKKNSMESNYQKYYAQRLQRRKERREAVKRANSERQSA